MKGKKLQKRKRLKKKRSNKKSLGKMKKLHGSMAVQLFSLKTFLSVKFLIDGVIDSTQLNFTDKKQIIFQ